MMAENSYSVNRFVIRLTLYITMAMLSRFLPEEGLRDDH